MRSNIGLNILLFSPYLPAADTTACARKVYDSVRVLHKRGHNVYLVSFCSQLDRSKINIINQYCKQVYLEHSKDYSAYPKRSICLTKNIEFLCKNRKVDLLQCENSYLCRYIPEKIGIPNVLVEHEVLSSSFKGRAKFERNPIKKFVWLARSLKKAVEESKWYPRYNEIIVFTEEDKEIIEKKYGANKITIIPLGINSKVYSLESGEKNNHDLVFVGNFSHAPNTNAVLHLYEDILPCVRKTLPDVSLLVGGANPPLSIRSVAERDKNITVTGYVENIDEIYSSGRVFVAPLRFGTGMRKKILEAMAFGLPVVTTSLGARGINHQDNLLIADTKEEFAAAVIRVLNDYDRYKKSAEEASIAIRKDYDWDVLINRYEEIYYKLRDQNELRS